jgi:Transglycosylase SLT domain
MGTIHSRKLFGPIVGVALLLALLVPASSLASEEAPTPTSSETTLTPEAVSPTPTTPNTTTSAPTVTATSETTPTPTPAPVQPETTTPVPSTPQVSAQSAQGTSSTGAPSAEKHSHGQAAQPGSGSKKTGGSTGEGASKQPHRGKRAPKPSALTPELPLSLSSSISGVPAFFIESFRIPPFLLPIYQAAGSAYGVPWQVLAAINEVETDYGRDLSVSSAGAEGWMQFLPSSWETYAVDANGDGFKDPYNPADAIFTAARYLRAAGAATNVRAAVLAYNHSQAYVESVMLRAKLLGGTPSGLLGAITGLTESRFPVHARSHFSDGFPTAPAAGGAGSQPLPATTIYSEANAPVIAVQDGQIVQIGDSPQLGRFISLRDAYGNTYTYADLGDVSQLYPVLEPHDANRVSDAQDEGTQERSEPRPTAPATAGSQLDAAPPTEEGASVSALSLGSSGVLSSAAPGSGAPAGSPSASSTTAPSPTTSSSATAGEDQGEASATESGSATRPQIAPADPSTSTSTSNSTDPSTSTSSPSSTPQRVFRDGPNDVYLHTLHTGVRVIAGTVLGHVGDAGGAGGGDEPHIVFEIRPGGVGAPLIDPKPILDGWVALENSSIFRAKGDSPFADGAPSAGQVLLESKEQLQRQVLANSAIDVYECGRQDIETGQIDRRVLATLEFLAVSGLDPTVSALKCGHSEDTTEGNVSEHSTGDAVDISEINGIPIEGHQGPGSITDTTIRKLLTLQGSMKPHQIISLMSFPGTDNTLAKADHYNHIHVGFAPDTAQSASVGGSLSSSITPGEWIKLISRLGEIPDPSVASGPSSAAIPDHAQAAGAH